MKTDLTIRPADVGDLDIVVAFNAALAKDTEGQIFEDATLRAGVRTALENPDLCHYFVAEREGQVVGQCMVTFEWTDWRNGLLWWFQSVYVHPDHRRSGVFRALYDHVVSAAKSDPTVRGMRLYVEKENASAMRTYEALGMNPSGHLVYELDWSQDPT